MSRPPPRARRPKRRFYVTLSRGDRIHCVSLRPLTFYALATAGALMVAMGVVGDIEFSSGGNLSMQAVRAQQEEMQAAYDDRLAALREQMDGSARADAEERQTLEGQMSRLAALQRTLDTRTEAISRLAQSSAASLGESGRAPSAEQQPAPGQSAMDALPSLPGANRITLPDPAGALGADHASNAKPRPEGVVLQSDRERTSAIAPDADGEPLSLRLAALDADAHRLRSEQLTSVAELASSIAQSAAKVRTALSLTGLSIDRLLSHHPLPDADDAEGGPYVPVRLDVEGSPLETEFDNLQDAIARNERIAAALPYLPLGKPLKGPLVTTSPFGFRIDPFLGRLAMHPGNDFRAAIGNPVLATADGKVTHASYDGGYGNMVEIDHGDGLATRYAHLSEINVRVGEVVVAGQMIGRVGATGRATGPHLHYEVRIDGQPVDPLRFVRAGESLVASR